MQWSTHNTTVTVSLQIHTDTASSGICKVSLTPEQAVINKVSTHVFPGDLNPSAAGMAE